MKFKSSLDTYSKCVSLLFIFVIISIFSILIIEFISNEVFVNKIIIFLILLILIIILFYILYNIPTSVVINKDAIIINRIFKKKIISYTNIKSISSVIHFHIPMSGSKGFLGYIGFTMGGGISFITNRKNVVIIKTRKGKDVFISPNNRKKFIEITNDKRLTFCQQTVCRKGG